MLGWPRELANPARFAAHLRLSVELGMSQVILVDHGLPPQAPARIDVWWRGRTNGSLMVILAYLLTRSWTWSRARIRLLKMLDEGETVEAATAQLENLLQAARLDADIEVVPKGDFKSCLSEYSGDADVVFLGFSPPNDDAAAQWHHTYSDFVSGLPTTLIVCSSGEADLFS